MTRSEIMRRNVGDELKPELTVHLYLQELGIQCERNDGTLPGTPDFAFHNGKLAVFVHGCFWHHCPKHGKLPKTNRKFWRDKFEQNRLRDARARRELRRMGWATMVVWEHDLKRRRGENWFEAGARVKRRLDRVRLDALTSQYAMTTKEKARLLKLRERKRRRVAAILADEDERLRWLRSKESR